MAKCEHDLRFQGLTRGGNAVCMICQGIRQGGVKALLEVAKEFERLRWRHAARSLRHYHNPEDRARYGHESKVYETAAAHCRDEAAKLEGEGDAKP